MMTNSLSLLVMVRFPGKYGPHMVVNADGDIRSLGLQTVSGCY